MSIDVASSGTVELSGKRVDLEVPEEEVRAGVQAWIEYSDGFPELRGEDETLARDYFAF